MLYGRYANMRMRWPLQVEIKMHRTCTILLITTSSSTTEPACIEIHVTLTTVSVFVEIV